MGEILFLMAGAGPLMLSLTARLAGYKLQRTYLNITLIILTLFAALRFQSGSDWPGYELFFDLVNLEISIISHLKYASDIEIEIGYYVLMRSVKALNGSYYHVLAICSVISGISVYYLYRPIKENTDFAIVSYLGYAYLLLGFEQARQSMGLAFVLFGIAFYLKNDKSIIWLFIIASLGVLFQYSVAIYIFCAVISYLVTRFPRIGRATLTIFFLIALLIRNSNVNLFQFFMLAAFNDTLVSKVNIYEAAPTTTSVLNSIFSVFILLNAILIYKNAKYQDNFRLKFLFNLTAFTLYLSFLVVFILPSFYYFYSRIYTLGSLLLPLTFFFLTSQKKSLIYTGFLVANYVALSLTYFRIIFTYSEQYLPYTPWLFKDF